MLRLADSYSEWTPRLQRIRERALHTHPLRRRTTCLRQLHAIRVTIGKSNPIPTVRFWVNAIENQEMKESKLPSDGDIRADTEPSL